MVEGRQRDQWNHTAQLLAMLYNAHKDPKSRPVSPEDFHPHKPRRPVRRTTLAELAAMGVLRKPAPQKQE